MFSKILAASLVAAGQGEDVVNVFYETDCPFSEGFVTDEVGPMMSDPNCLQNEIKLNWVPWGNAQEANGAVLCQHGPDECFGNRLHICAEEMFGGDDVGMTNFVVCHETNIKGNQFANIPNKQAQDESSYASCQCPPGKAPGDLTRCANGQDASIPVWQKFREAGALTAATHPQHAPWAVWANGDNSANMQGNLVAQLCARVQARGVNPQCCQAMGRRLLV